MRKIENTLSSSNLLTALFVSLFLFLLGFLPFLEITERGFLDLAFRIRGARPPHQDIVIVEINQSSLSKLGTWPWPRSYYGSLLAILAPYKPKAVFFDILVSEESKKEEDALFAEGLEKIGSAVLPFYFPVSNSGQLEEINTLTPEGVPIPALYSKAKGFGYVNVFPDSDGHVREVVLTTQQGQLFPHASLKIASLHPDFHVDIKSLKPGKGTLINYPGPYRSFQIIPFEDLISTAGSPASENSFLNLLKGKIILVGHTATGTAMDLKATAFSPVYPGIAIQASMVHTLLTRQFIHRLPGFAHLLTLFLFALLIAGFGTHANPLKAFFLSLGSLLIVFEVTQLLFGYFQIWLPYFSFLITGLLVYLIITLRSLVEVGVEREILSRELALASKIQSNFLPTEIPEIKGLKMATVSYPANEVGGDLYDILPLSDGRWGICIGDVSGKGIPAALFMGKVLSDFRREAMMRNSQDGPHAQTFPPGQVLEKFNTQMYNEGTSGLFLTLIYFILDPENSQFVFSSAGHEPLFFYCKSKKTVEMLSTQAGTPIGITPEMNFDQVERKFSAGDVLVFYTDGVKESMNLKREIFGMSRIETALLESADRDPESIIQNILKRIKEFIKEAPQHDDLTMVCIKFS